MRYLLDTDTSVALLRNQSLAIARIERCSPDDCAISTITVYELMTGVRKCRRPEVEAAKVDTLMRQIHVLSFDDPAARQSAIIRVDLEKRGLPIGPYDLLIAGQALAADLMLVTSNQREFERIPGLKSEDWLNV